MKLVGTVVGLRKRDRRIGLVGRWSWASEGERYSRKLGYVLTGVVGPVVLGRECCCGVMVFRTVGIQVVALWVLEMIWRVSGDGV